MSVPFTAIDDIASSFGVVPSLRHRFPSLQIGRSTSVRTDADGPQRLVPIGEVALARDQAALNPEDLAEARIDLDAAGAGAQPDPAKEGDYVAGIDDLERRVVEELP